ncbi:Cys-tRNA(Pro) deacylase [Glaciecola sp. XM2]|jgi:Cys-tRNA(Pro)/Cys-tRNA(Cys) deacylase|uniref:Cys-tRNA(Pro) deacylase n=1 Tax=Glaciecola sp. XM2 TaxID=1914931 RepID=UPI001BDED5AD|nr:Cys-tRNA(Pro) deacylase [Glaciecola sp. XM2]MBT1452023.1 Cys-tRNA(Pro) deacylase [Glaciecola sp. XM2]
MTPGIISVKKHKIEYKVHEYEHDDSIDSYGQEASDKLGVSAIRVFKTLVVSLDSHELIVAVVPVACMLSMKHLAKVVGAKKAVMADKALVERTTGYVLGGVSPLGQKKRLRTIVDASAQSFETIYVSAGRRGLEIELRPSDLVNITGAVYGKIGR